MNQKVKAYDIFTAYEAWARDEVEGAPKTAKAFGMQMKERFKSKKTKEGMFYLGIRLKPPPPKEDEDGEGGARAAYAALGI